VWINTTNVSARRFPHTGTKIQTPLQNLHGRFQERRKGRLCSDLEPPGVWPQNTIYSAEQSAIITVIHYTMKEAGKKVIATDSQSTLIAASDKKDTKNPKTRTIRKLLQQDNTTLGNEEADNAAKESLDENLEKPEEYPPQDLANWMTQQHEEQQQQKMGTDRLRNEKSGNNKKQGKTTPAI
jgi:hypothetical protein